jgi:adenosylcobinamide-GDP ribazoletransferase
MQQFNNSLKGNVLYRQAVYFFTACMFFTRLPVPTIPYSLPILQKSARYFSWVGVVVGFVAAVTYFLLQQYVSISLAIVVSTISTILLTGAFHEDGWADSCDAFGGGYTPEKILVIMKDSRLGTYGVIGLIGMLSTKFLLLTELSTKLVPWQVAASILCAHSISRLCAVGVMQLLPYVQDIDTSKVKPLANRKLYAYEWAVALLPLLLGTYFLPTAYVLTVFPCCFMVLLCAWYFKRKIGGYTGDCLGATQQVTECVCYITNLVLWSYI